MFKIYTNYLARKEKYTTKRVYLQGNCVSRPMDRPRRPRSNGRRQQSQSQHGQAQNHSRHEHHGQKREHQPVQQLQQR